MKESKLGQMLDDLSRDKTAQLKTSLLREMNARKKGGGTSEPSRISFFRIPILSSVPISFVCLSSYQQIWV
jgi:hypothetical protein